MLKVGRDSLFWGMVSQEEKLWGNQETRGCAEEKERNASCRSHLCWRRWCWRRANLPNHCLKIFKPRKAQILSWCKFKRGLPCPDKPHHLDSVFKEPLEKIYDRLSEPALLIICLPGYTQNANDFVDALAWNKCPKHELHGRKGIVMAASCAALHFSCGATKKIWCH